MEKVIFDTNAYRYLSTGRSFDEIDKLINKVNYREQKNNIETLISPIVAKELLAHVANKKDPSYDKCLKAIKALYLHSGNDQEYSMIASSELLISKAFFDRIIPSKVETNKAIGQIIYHLATNPSDYVITKFQRNLNLNYEHVISSENEFALAMKQFITSLDPNIDEWKVFVNDDTGRTKALKQIRSIQASKEIALGYLFLVYQLLVFSGEISVLPTKDILDRADKFVEIFPEPIALYKVVMENLINSEFNLFENSRSNFVWDIHLMFNIGKHSIGGSQLIFVTADKAMIKTAIGENAQYSILTFDEYMEYLGLK